MPRKKRQNPLVAVARAHLSQYVPELKDAPLRVRMLDGPPGSPRYAVTVESCPPGPCPHGMPPEVAAAGTCPIQDCPLRNSIRLLLDRSGAVVQITRNHMHWD
ncbi:MAG TPA: hypothetical protein VNL77_03595 [Roseiflexaceae bacterium]|nr:hypothetical protein [Roseiflexaceae bacterium]